MDNNFFGASIDQERRNFCKKQIKVGNDQAFLALGHSFAISPAPHPYTLQWSVTGDFSNDCTDVVSVAANEPCSGMHSNGVYFRCHGLGADDKVIVAY